MFESEILKSFKLAWFSNSCVLKFQKIFPEKKDDIIKYFHYSRQLRVES